MKQKTIRIISSILCIFVLLSNISVAHGTQDIDITEELSYTEFEHTESSNYSMGRTKMQSSKTSAVIKTPFFIVFVHESPHPFSTVKTVFFIGSEVEVKAETEFYSLVVNKSGAEGYVFNFWLSEETRENPEEEEPTEKPEEEIVAEFNRKYDHVYAGKTNQDSSGKPRAKLLYTGSGNVAYSTNNTNVISVDSETGLITGKKPGTAYLIASVDGTEKDRIPVYCIYEWEQGWTGKANESTKIYTGTSASTASLGTLSTDANFYVYGDDGGSAGWAYGYATVSGSQKWGFVKINDISTKGTVSQYNSLGWTWPLKDKTINFISSPYAPRSDSTPTTIHHRGMDLTTGNEGEIKGESVVAAYSGVVKYIRANIDSCGYCVSISSNSVDSVTGEKIAIIYMHLQELPKYADGSSLKRGDTLNAGTEIGKVGNTDGNSNPDDMGYHLHFETNNKNAGVGDEGRSNFINTINPIYFYRDKDVTLSTICEAYSKGYGAYWYASNN